MHALMSGKHLEHNTASIIPRQVWNISLYLFLCLCSFILCLATDNSWMMYMYYCDMFSGFFFFLLSWYLTIYFLKTRQQFVHSISFLKNRLKNKNMLKRGIGMDNRSTGEKFELDWCSHAKCCFNFSRKLNTVCIRIHLNFNESAYSTFPRKNNERKKKENELIICCFLIGSLTCLSYC